MSVFSSLSLSAALREGMQSCGLTSASRVQEQTLPAILKGENVIAQGLPASGKTIAFSIGLLQKLSGIKTDDPQALVLVPTHELAVQVADTLKKLGKGTGIKCHVSIGGIPVKVDLKAISNGVNIIVGTLGRVANLLTMKNAFPVNSLSVLVLDEADMLLTKDFRRELSTISEALPTNLQVILFSTTMPAKSLQAAKQLVKKHSSGQTRIISLQRKELMSDTITQFYVNTSNKKSKCAVLSAMFPMFADRKSLIFCNLRKNVEEIMRVLKKKGFTVPCIHSEMSEEKRQKVISTFRKSAKGCLITTDLLARGFDLPSVSLVVNCNTPKEDEYLHRIYRCSRFGSKGLAVSIFKKKEISLVGRLQRQFACTIQEMPSGLTNIF